jgi:hypothetical protein
MPTKKTKKKTKRKTRKKTALAKLDVDKDYKWLSRKQKATLLDGGYFDAEGVLHNGDGCIRCTSVVSHSGKRCKNFAVPGELHCRCHGGVLARSKAQKGTRLYSAFIQNPKISQVYESIVNDDELRGMKEELGMLRALLAKVVGDEAKDITSKSLKDVANVVGEIRQLINDCTKTEIRLGQLIDIGKITIIVKQLAAIITKHITDEEILRKIAVEFDDVIWPSSGGTTPQPERKRAVRGVQVETY